MEIKNILIIRSDRFGEFILSLPAIKLVKESYPSSKIYLLAQKNNIELVRNSKFIDFFYEYKPEYFAGFRGALRLSGIFRRENIDCVIILNPKKEFHLASFLAGVSWRVGYDRKWGWCLNRKIKDKKYLGQKHEVEYNIDLVSLICKKVFVPKVEILPNQNINGLKSLKMFNTYGLDLDSKYIIFHPFSSNERKQYSLGNAGRLIEQINEKVVLIGSGDYLDYAARLENSFPQKIINICGKTSLGDLTVLFKNNCKVLITTDSGPMHLASFLGANIIALFGPSNATRWGPVNDNAIVLTSNEIDDISPQQIISSLAKIT